MIHVEEARETNNRHTHQVLLATPAGIAVIYGAVVIYATCIKDRRWDKARHGILVRSRYSCARDG